MPVPVCVGISQILNKVFVFCVFFFLIKDKLSGKQEKGVGKSEHKPNTGTAGIQRFYQHFLFCHVCICHISIYCVSLALLSLSKYCVTQIIFMSKLKIIMQQFFWLDRSSTFYEFSVCVRYSWLEVVSSEEQISWRKSILSVHLFSQITTKIFLYVCSVYILTVKNSIVNTCDLRILKQINWFKTKYFSFKKMSKIRRNTHWIPQQGSF